VRGVGETFRAGTVIIAAGSVPRSLGIPGEERLQGRGVSHCASCDGPFFKGQEVGVVGGGDAALDEALVLAEHAARVTIFHRGPTLRAQHALVERASGKISIAFNTVVEEILGDETVTGVRLRDITSGATRSQALKALFVQVGAEPNTAFLRGVLALDPIGHVETDAMMRTSVPGIFAAGDIRKSSVAQLAAVAGDGATAALAAFRYLRLSARRVG
jgi:thioredoxin reductase (NADPH)